MNPGAPSRKAGLTLIEALIVVAVLSVMAGVMLPGLIRPRRCSCRINCVNQLKQVGLSYRQWALDNNDRYPAQVSIAEGGAREWAAQGLAGPIFQVMSNELNSPRILICPEDPRRTIYPGASWQLGNSNLSYFAAVDADETQPQMILSGDSNLEIGGGRLTSGLVMLLTNRPVGWSATRHVRQGNIGLADGSVQGCTAARLREALTRTGDATNRIVLP